MPLEERAVEGTGATTVAKFDGLSRHERAQDGFGLIGIGYGKVKNVR